MSYINVLGPQYRVLSLSDCQLPYWRVGQGPDLIFIHGWPVDARTWRHVTEHLKHHFTCHLIDLPRAGASVWEDVTRSGVRALGQVVLEAIDRMELSPRFGLVGHNTGGSFARVAAAQIPERIAGMVLGNTEIPYRFTLRLRALFFMGGLPGLGWLLSKVLSTRVGRTVLGTTGPSSAKLLHNELHPLFFEPLTTDRHKMRAAINMLKTIRVRDFNEVIKAHEILQSPIRLIWGSLDPWFPLKHARSMQHTFKQAPIDLIEVVGAGLMVHEERPELFARAVTEHFAKCSF